MKPLQVLLLGPPEVRWNGNRLSIQRRQTRALLFYLASQANFVGRNHLLTVFWEDQPDEKARQRLRETLNKLRAALTDPSLLITDGDLVGLDSSRVYVDQLDFQRLIAQTGHLPWLIPASQALPYPIYQIMLETIQLWRGGHFLSGANLPSTMGLDHWLSLTTQKVENQRLRILERLAEHCAVIGDLNQAIYFLHQALEINSFDEYLHERLLRHLIDLGRLQEAGAHFRSTQSLFWRELQAQPGPQLQSLVQQISQRSRPTDRSSNLNWHIHQTLHTPFVGRQAALEQLNLAWRKGGGIFILGEPGIGKTRLLQEFVAQLDPKPRLVMGRCLPAEGGLPLQPILDGIRHDLTPEDWNSLPVQWITPILTLYPELATIRPDLPPHKEHPPEQAHTLLIEAFRQLGVQICRSQRLLAIIDDAQWADETTLALLAYLIERPPFDGQALLVIIARGGYENPLLDNLLLAMGHSSRTAMLRLERLDLQEVTELAHTVLAADLSPGFVERLSASTGGNPLHILESLRALLESGYMPGDPERITWPLLPSLQAVIRSRLQSLSATARAVLETAAILGSEFNPLLLVEVCPYSPHDVVQALEELKQRYLLHHVANNLGDISYRFIHAQIRETLLSEINPLRAQVIHGKVARVLETRLGEAAQNQAALLAAHYEAAGDVEIAFEQWVQAGLRARQLFSATEAHENFARAEKLLTRVADCLPDESLLRLYIEWGDFAYNAGDHVTLDRIHQDLLQWAEKHQRHLLIASALIGLCDSALLTNQFARALDYVDQALHHLEYTPTPIQKVRAYSRRGVIFYLTGRYNEAAQSLELAIEFGRDAQQPLALRALGDAYVHRAMLYNMFGWPIQAQEYAVKALEIQMLLKHPGGQLHAYTGLALAQCLSGEFTQGRLNAQTGIALAEQTHNWRGLGILCAIASMIDSMSGHIGSGVINARRAIEIGNAQAYPEVIVLGYRALGDIYLSLRSYDLAWACFEHGVPPRNDNIQGLDIMMRYGATLCLANQYAKGLPYLTQAIDRADQLGLVYGLIGKIFKNLADLRWVATEQTESLTLQLEEETHRRYLLPWNLTNCLTRGLAAMKHSDFEAALTHFDTVIANTAVLSLPWIEIRAQTYKAQILSQQGLSTLEQQQHIAILLAHLESSIETEKGALGNEIEVLRASFQAYRLTLMM